MSLPNLCRRLPRLTPMLRWMGLALLGILIAAAISIAASRLASQQIGLASQPISAGNALAPPGKKRETPQPTSRSHAAKQQPHGSPSSPPNPAPEPEPAPEPNPAPEPEPAPSSPSLNPAPPTQPDDSGGSGGADHIRGADD
jgi:outer membrane biosynthesis protein TonB